VLHASAKSGNTNTVMLGDPGHKKLRLSPHHKIYIQNEVGREMGCGVGDPPYANKKKIKKIVKS
jgi:hypothetical protein